jgi:hypothetical protein
MNELQIEYIARDVHAKYAGQIGSEQIAQLSGLRLIGSLVVSNNYRTFLEIGSGIGTIAEFVFRVTLPNKIFYNCFEINAWCQEKLLMNLDEYGFDLVDTNQKLLDLNKEVEFLIVDDLISFEETYSILKNTSPSMIFVEGHRRAQRLDILKCCRKMGKKVYFTNYKKTKDSYKVGCTFELSKDQDNSIYAFTFVLLSLLYSKVVELRSRISIRALLRISR